MEATAKRKSTKGQTMVYKTYIRSSNTNPTKIRDELRCSGRVSNSLFSFIFMTYHRFVTRLTRRVSLVEQELLTLPEHLSSSRILVGFVLLDLMYVLYMCGYFS
jgi:hypothetical protein